MSALLKTRFTLLTLTFITSVSAMILTNIAHAEARLQDLDWSNQVLDIKDHWVRATNPGQDVGAAYMTLISKLTCDLIDVKTDVAGTVEIHSMTMDKGVMKMRQLKTLLLEENKPVKLTPGGFHLMLFDLKKPLAAGEKIDFSLTLKCNDVTLSPLSLTTTVKSGEAED